MFKESLGKLTRNESLFTDEIVEFIEDMRDSKI
jgi:hypothetical protein